MPVRTEYWNPDFRVRIFFAVRNDHQLVVQIKLAASVRNKEGVVALDGHDQFVVRQRQVHQPVAFDQHVGGHVDFGQGGFDLRRQFFEVEFPAFGSRVVRQFQFFSHEVHRRALYDQRDDRDEEYDVEDQRCVFDTRRERISGENDRYGAAQTDPRHVGFGAGTHFAERK